MSAHANWLTDYLIVTAACLVFAAVLTGLI